ncbi:hypothetical protein SLEP1_g56939 [Rubroshorea leprosula]|uniref:SWIM-type domain-containing protein n=1 Tax=Rubroshorea leprosula TaxID=152421 RepID=A0AAV5MNQ2_9ROSI|nr:hypothetical protein SLEP1_g56939 [Rubroshorea leprosula]
MDPNDPKIVDVDLEPSEEILEDEGEHDSGNEAETKFVPIFIHLGGRFIQGVAPSEKGTVDDNPVEVEGRVENDHVDVEGKVEDAGHTVEVEGRVEDADDDGNEDNEHSEDEDDFLPYISELSDNEDEETVEARKKMKSLHEASLHEATSRSKNARKGVKYGRSQPSATSHEIPSSSIGHNDLGPEDSLSSDDDISYISTSEEDGSEVEHARRRKGRHKVLRGTNDGNVLINVVADLFPNAEHRHYARHRYANFKKKHKGKELQALFWRCVKALNEAKFNTTLVELGKLKPATRDDIMNVDPKHWSRAFFKAEIKSSVVDNNMSRTVFRREFGSAKFVGEFGSKIWTKIVRNRKGSKKCKVLWPGGGGFEVEDYLNSKNKVDSGRNTYIVDFEDRKCTCRYWDISGIPCRHAMTVPQMENEPSVEQPPLVEDNHPPSVDDNQPPHGEDNQPCIAEEELVNMTQEDPPVSQVVSPTPPVQ